MATAQTELFPVGEVSFARSALAALREASSNEMELLRQHQCGAWDDQPHVQSDNLAAVKESGWVCSSFEMPTGKTVWFMTEPNRSTTIVLLEEP